MVLETERDNVEGYPRRKVRSTASENVNMPDSGPGASVVGDREWSVTPGCF